MHDSAIPGGAARIGGGHCPSMRKFSRLTVLSGPSGAGKSTVIAELRRFCPELWLSVYMSGQEVCHQVVALIVGSDEPCSGES